MHETLAMRVHTMPRQRTDEMQREHTKSERPVDSRIHRTQKSPPRLAERDSAGRDGLFAQQTNGSRRAPGDCCNEKEGSMRRGTEKKKKQEFGKKKRRDRCRCGRERQRIEEETGVRIEE